MAPIRFLCRRTAAIHWVLAAVMLAFPILPGCGSSGGSSRPSDGGRTERATKLYGQVKQAHELERDGQTLDLADQLLDLYPDFPDNDRVLDMAADASVRRHSPDRALDYTDLLLSRYPDSPVLSSALDRAAGLALDLPDTLRAAEYLAWGYAHDPARASGEDGLPVGHDLFMTMGAGDLSDLTSRHGGDAAGPYLRFMQVGALLEAGSTSEARDVAETLVMEAPDSPWTAATLELTGEPRSGRYLAMGPVLPDRVGIVCPLTGRYAVLGNAFYEAALLAVDVTNAELGLDLELVAEDSGGDPVMSALAGRRLAGPQGCVALLGSLMSGPTVSLAVVADQFGVPLVSPTATNDRIWELGEGIFQTNLTGLFEVRLLARLATTVLLKRKFGLLYPDTPEAHRHAEVFRAEVETLGGEVVSEVAFPAQGTNFRPPIRELKKARPEVIFTPATVDQMIMLGPQLDFFRAGSLVMGLSNWNSTKLAENSETVLDRALFPDDQALVPPEWAIEFHERWDPEPYPREATAIALRAYQATRLLLETLGRSGATTRSELADALRNRLAEQDVEAAGPDSFARLIRMFHNGQIVPFPAEIFAESWEMAEAEIDSLDTEIEEDGGPE